MSCDSISWGPVGFAYGFMFSAILFGVLSGNRKRNEVESVVSTMAHINRAQKTELENNKLVIDDLNTRIHNSIQAAETLKMNLEEYIYADMPPLIPCETLDTPIPPPAQRTETYASMLEDTCPLTPTVPPCSQPEED